MAQELKYISDCCLAPCFNVEGENGTCALCGRPCFACEKEKLEPLTEYDRMKMEFNSQRNEQNLNQKKG